MRLKADLLRRAGGGWLLLFLHRIEAASGTFLLVGVHLGCKSSDFRSLGRNFARQHPLKNGQLALICKIL
jgi:hypothetical protein